VSELFATRRPFGTKMQDNHEPKETSVRNERVRKWSIISTCGCAVGYWNLTAEHPQTKSKRTPQGELSEHSALSHRNAKLGV
jgi:hypothetical protein